MNSIEEIVQWNMGSFDGRPNGKVVNVLEALIDEHHPGLFALQEFPEKGTEQILRNRGYDVRQHVGRRRKLSAVSSSWSVSATATQTHHSGLLLGLKHLSFHLEVNFWNVHFPAHADPRERRGEIRGFAREVVRRYRKDPWHEIVAGDFNFEPFDESIAGVEGFGANRSVAWVRSQNKKRTPEERLLVNRAWSLMSVETETPGSYYNSSFFHGPWLALDQLLVSCSLQNSELPPPTVITEVGGFDLRSSRVGQPSSPGSDHFPILAQFCVDH